MDVERYNTRAQGKNGQKEAIDSLIERIAEEIAAQVAAQQFKKRPNADKDLRSLLRRELDLHVEDNHGKFDSTMDSVGQVHSVRSFEWASCASEVSNVTGGRKAPMDIFHPSFWSEEGKVERIETNDILTQTSGNSLVESDLVNLESRMNELTLQLPFVLDNDGQRIHSTDVELRDDENGSVLSDITGVNEKLDDSTRAPIVSMPAPSTKPPTAAKQLLSSYDSGSSIFGSQTKSNTTVSSDSKIRRKKRVVSYSVSFRDVQVREYERIMCDNPACSTGPSIGIGWNYEPNDPVPVEDYEVLRRRQRSGGELVLSRSSREKLIQNLGYSDRDIAATVRELNKLRYHRRQTVNNLGVQKMEEAVENATRRVKSILFLSRN